MGGDRRGRAATTLVALVAFEGAAVVALHGIGGQRWARVDWSDIVGWLDATAPEDVAAAVARLVALGGAYWLLSTTVVYLAARVARLPRLVHGVGWATLPGVRGVVDKVVAASIVVPMFLGGASTAMASDTTITKWPNEARLARLRRGGATTGLGEIVAEAVVIVLPSLMNPPPPVYVGRTTSKAALRFGRFL